MNLKFLLDQRAALLASLNEAVKKAEAESRMLSDAEEQLVAENKKAIEKINGQIDLLQGVADGSQTSTPVATAAAQALPNHIPAMSGKKEFDSLNEFMGAVISGGNDPRLEYRSQQNMGTGSAGGFMVPTTFVPQIFSVDPQASLVRGRANVIPAGTPPDAEITFPALDQNTATDRTRVFGGVTIEKVAEGGQKPLTEGKLRMISLKPEEMAAVIPLTDKLRRNWTAASTWAADLLRKGVLAFEDVQFLTGNGVGGPLGAINSASAYEVARAVANQVSFADIKKMEARFMGDGPGIWVASAALWEQLLGLVGDGGGATNIISVNQTTGQISIYGKPVIKHQRVPGLGQVGDLGLYDFSQYLIKDGSGPLVEAGYDDGQWRRNASSIKVTWNVDGRSWLTAPYKGEDDYETSPFVLLGAPAAS